MRESEGRERGINREGERVREREKIKKERERGYEREGRERKREREREREREKRKRERERVRERGGGGKRKRGGEGGVKDLLEAACCFRKGEGIKRMIKIKLRRTRRGMNGNDRGARGIVQYVPRA